MKNERLFDAIGQIEEEFIDEADPEKKHKKKIQVKGWVKIGVLAACVLVIVGISVPHIFNHDGGISGGTPEEPELE